MPKELYLYSPIYDFVAKELIQAIEENMGEDIVLRENTPGGSVFAAYGIYQKIKEHGNVSLKIDGAAMSAGAFLPLYCKYVEILDVSRIVFHRADMYVSTPEDQVFLDSVNKDLKAQMKKKIDADIFKEITGFSIEEMFDPEKRIDISITGADAKKMGLVDKVVKLTPEMQSEITAFNQRFNIAATVPPVQTQKINNIMDIQKLKAEHPAVYAEILALGVKDGVAQEKNRVKAFMAFMPIDAEAAKAAINDGTEFTPAHIAEFSAKAIASKQTDAVVEEGKKGVPPAPTAEADKTAKEKEVGAFMDEVKSLLK